MANIVILVTTLSLIFVCSLQNATYVMARIARFDGGSTRFYDFKVQMTRIRRLCSTKDIVTINGMYPGPVVYAQEDDTVTVRITNQSPYNITIHWHGVRQKLSCWSDGPSYISQCPIQSGQNFTHRFTLVGQKGTLFWHAHSSWLRGTVYGAIVVHPKTNVPYPFKSPFEEHIITLGEYWLKNLVQLEQDVLSGGGIPPPADAFTINGYPGPNYNCSDDGIYFNYSIFKFRPAVGYPGLVKFSSTTLMHVFLADVYKIDVFPGRTYLLRIINAALNTENFFSIANHNLTIVEADGEYIKPVTLPQLMLAPGQTMNVLVTADQPIAKYSISMGPYISGQNVTFQNITSIAYFQYPGILPNISPPLPAQLPSFNDSRAVKAIMDGIKSLNNVNVPKDIDTNLFITVGLNVQTCKSDDPKKHCRGRNNGVMAASMNNVSFVKPNISLLEAYYRKINGYFTEDFPDFPLGSYDFVSGAPNNAPNDTQSMIGTKVKVIEYGSRVQIVLQDTGTVTTENHPIHLHGYSFYVVGYGTGNYDPQAAVLNTVDPPSLNTIGVPVGGWAVIRFVADNPGVWFMHCHLEVHSSWGLSMALIVKNGQGEEETLPDPPEDMPRC